MIWFVGSGIIRYRLEGLVLQDSGNRLCFYLTHLLTPMIFPSASRTADAGDVSGATTSDLVPARAARTIEETIYIVSFTPAAPRHHGQPG